MVDLTRRLIDGKGVHELVNQTTREPLAHRIIRCDTFGRRLRGLMFRRRLLSDEAYLFVFENESIVAATVHMLFVFFPISLVWLDAQRRVVDVRMAKSFCPYYAPRKAARYLIEGVPRLLDRVSVGDLIGF
jgi:uncharacterized membrane protein (UPF0127 family)